MANSDTKPKHHIAGPKSNIRSHLKDASKRLVETGTRNRLVHVNRSIKRAKVLNVINGQSADLYNLLRVKERKLRFLAKGCDGVSDNDGPLLLELHEEISVGLDQARVTELGIETPLGPNELQKRLKDLSYAAHTAEEEQGINILYLALGFLTWFEQKKPATKREAPLILLPVDLVHNKRRSTYEIRAREDELVTNLPLQERLKTDFGLTLPEIDEDDAWTPDVYFDQIEKLIKGSPGWKLDGNGCQIGFFSFAKLLMMRDLDPLNWSGDMLTTHPLVRALLTDGFGETPTPLDQDDCLDQVFLPADIIQVVDADGSQTRVIEAVREGHNLVVQGPPGTGKSQTITNIIAAAVHDGKTVLFMAEKMAALSVVHGRMKREGLENLCLELHSRGVSKKALAQELGRTLLAGRNIPKEPDAPDELTALRHNLNAFTTVMHSAVGDFDYTPFQALSELVGFIGKDAMPPRIPQDGLAELSQEQVQNITRGLVRFVSLTASCGMLLHPFKGTRALDIQPPDIIRLSCETETARTSLAAVEASVKSQSQIVSTIHMGSLNDASRSADLIALLQAAPGSGAEMFSAIWKVRKQLRFAEALAAAIEWQKTRDTLSGTFHSTAWQDSANRLRAQLHRGAGSFFARISPGYWRASADLAGMLTDELPNSAKRRLDLVDQLIDAQAIQQAYQDDEAYLRKAMDDHWRGERTDFRGAAALIRWLNRLAETGQCPDRGTLQRVLVAPIEGLVRTDDLRDQIVEAQAGLDTVFARLNLDPVLAFGHDTPTGVGLGDLIVHFDLLRANSGRYGEWVNMSRAGIALDELGQSKLRSMVDAGIIAPQDGQDEFLYALAEARWHYAIGCVPILEHLRVTDRHALVKLFGNLETRRRKDVQTKIRARHLTQLPRGNGGEMRVILGEIKRPQKNGRHIPIRKLILSAGSMLQRIKPVFLMSPISIAQFLPPESVSFDLLVIDEASQVRPEDALGAAARARQIVVVGDNKQLPPTSFFDRLTSNAVDVEEEESTIYSGARATEMESVLSLCEARGMPVRMLEWHYRSRDPSLIHVSNREFYKNELILPPAPVMGGSAHGLNLQQVNGVYSSRSKGGGRAGTNRIEAEAVAKEVAAHARNSPNLSLGIVTFSAAQRKMVDEVLESARQSDIALDALLSKERSGSGFVKNIENVQGDERDVILISVGYGPNTPEGPLRNMSFGPINNEGGERRLNVMFSRARVCCKVFVSFDPNDLDTSRATHPGPEVLKKFLTFAKDGAMQATRQTGSDPDSPLEEDVASAIRELGYEADHHVGTDTFRIGIGVRHAGQTNRYILAVECDGARYHNSQWARERDRQRQSLLEKMGWRFHRIWCTDWFFNRNQQITRLREVLENTSQDDLDNQVSTSSLEAVTGSDGPDAGVEGQRTLVLERETVQEHETFDLSNHEIIVAAYERATFAVTANRELHEIPTAALARIAARVVKIEGPIHEAEIVRRVTSLFGKSRVGTRITGAVKLALQAAQISDDVNLQCDAEGFWQIDAQQVTPTVRSRLYETGTILKASNLSRTEIVAAALLLDRECGRIVRVEKVRLIARLLGYKSLGPALKSRIENIIEHKGKVQ